MAGWQDQDHAIYHFRDRDGHEVDIVVEREDGLTIGIETKASATVVKRDFAGLQRLAGACGRRFAMGVVLHDGGTVVPFGDRLFAAPIACLWS